VSERSGQAQSGSNASSSVRDLQSLIAGGGVRGRRVFVRSDLNVPLESRADGTSIADDSRIQASLPTLRTLVDGGARVIVASHLGRPKGIRDERLSLAPIADALAAQLSVAVRFCPECVGPIAERAAATLRDGEVLLLENLRFEPGEQRNDPEFAAQLARLCDVYVNDAFGTAHRAHASTAGMVPRVGESAAGLLMQSELEHLEVVLNPRRPLLCLLGGAKVSDKLGVLEALAQRADVLAVGGAMAYTFLAARGDATGTSLVEPDRFDDARKIVRAVAESSHRLLLPVDHVIAKQPIANGASRIVETIPDGWMGLDIGPETAERYAHEAHSAQTILWNGPMGVYEQAAYARGTERVAVAVAESQATSVVGGGDSLAAIRKLGLSERIGHLSTGGGASLEYVQGKTLPGVEPLLRRSPGAGK
jgi:phosphoglycerate kinase